MRLRAGVAAAVSAWIVAGTAFAQPYEAPPPPPSGAAVPLPDPGEPALPPDAPPPEEPCVAPCFDTMLPGRDHTTRLAVLGLRVGSTDAQAFNMSVAFAGRAAETRSLGFTNDRATFFWVLGGGGAGFEGALGGSLAAGLRAPIDRLQGIVFRAGLEGYILGNQTLYASMFELPQGQIAYQWARSDGLFEIGGKGGAVLTGRYREPDLHAERRIPLSAEWGGYASLHFWALRIDAAYTRIETRGDAIGTPLDVFDGNLCGLTGPIAFCSDLRYEHGTMALAGGGGTARETSYFGGITIGPRLGPWRRERRENRENRENRESASTGAPIEQ